MNQTPTVLTRNGAIQVDIPAASAELLAGVKWGAVEAFPSPAYFAFQVIARRIIGQPAQYSLGRSLAEEVGACLLGGHGVPGEVGIAAYESLRAKGAFCANLPSQGQLEAWLREPINVGARIVHYRFARRAEVYCGEAATRLAS